MKFVLKLSLFSLLFQTYWAGPNTRIPPPIEPDQWNKPNMLSNMDDRCQDPSFIGQYIFVLTILID